MVGIDIISGFLGSGKTTFANKLLQYYLSVGERAIYIVNEFGNTGLDAQIARHNGFSSVELSNGCVCCTLKNDVTLAMREVIKTFKPTKIVFEPSGIFVFNNFFDILKDPFLAERCFISNLITIIDSLSFKRIMAAASVAGSFVENQIVNADTLIISKLEKFTGDVTELLCDASNINPDTVILSKPFDEIDDADLEVFRTNKSEREEKPFGLKHKKLKTCTLTPRSFDDAAIERLIAAIKAGEAGTVYRVKGIIKKDGAYLLLNIAFDDVEIKPQRFFKRPKLTFIGESVDADAIKRLCGDVE